ncbi:protein dachsous-like [Limulus polyphemus]|uniref:Protein dachsous-like n=1 Tax=Limulus polyphemus TaxID=6850 RepID=A0ABM1RWC7_LIMPO|nr:protein dachsous-like [Limulus polyphemus]
MSSSVVVVMASDVDSGVFGRITYTIVDGNGPGLFTIDENTGEIFVIGHLDTATRLHHLEISAQDGAGLTSDNNAHVYLSVLTHSQQPPTFEHARYSFSVGEDVVPQTLIGTVKVSGSNRGKEDVRYSIYSGDPEKYFSINPSTGAIITRRTLDHETHPILLLNVQATRSRPPSYGHTQVNITILDVNDNAPQFKSMSFKISVPENTELNAPIYVAQADDSDSEANGAIHYHIIQNPDGIFSIDSLSGILSLQKRLDYETQQRYILLLKAADTGVSPKSSTMTLTVDVQDVNDNAPEFEKSNYQINVLELLAINSQFLQVSATDRDTGNNARLTYKLSSGNEKKFGIFPNNGYLYLKDTLDREDTDRYTLNVLAVDNGIPPLSANATILVRVLDANDNSPEFEETKFLFTVEENIERGKLVGTVAARDKDLGNNASLRYSLLLSNSSFQINPITGEIFTKTTLDRENISSYELTAEVRDQGSPSRSNRAMVVIRVLDENDNHPIFVMPTDKIISVREEQPVGTEVVQVEAIDADEGENASVTYSIIPEHDGSAHFTIHHKRGVITTKAVLDYEEKNEYKLTVVARDNGFASQEGQLQLKIHVLDLNDNQPTFPTSALTFRIPEGIPVGEEVGLVQAVDQDGGENGRVTYSIISGNLYGIFDISRTTGALFTVDEVDYEMSSEYTLQVKAVDSSTANPRSSVISVKVHIEDINDCVPTFKTDPILFSIPENTREDTIIWNFSATDEDNGDNGLINYAITHQSPSSVFKVDTSTGSLTLTEKLDHESFPEFIIIITATDQAKEKRERLSSSATCKIIVEDENDNSPVFQTRSRIDILENEPVGFPLLHIVATDADSRDNGRVTYIITSGDENGNFALDYDTGAMRSGLNGAIGERWSIITGLFGHFDREKKSSYKFQVRATDSGQYDARSEKALVHITVLDINDNKPIFKKYPYIASVSAHAHPGVQVIHLEATDLDQGPNAEIHYSFISPPLNAKFHLDSQSGVVTVTGSLLPDAGKVFHIEITANDNGQPPQATSGVLEIIVGDGALVTPPKFQDETYRIELQENPPKGLEVTSVRAVSLDNQNTIIKYSFPTANDKGAFTINSETGHIKVHDPKQLDFESSPHLRIAVIAQTLSPLPVYGYASLIVQLIDKNDNPPRFSQERYVSSVWEGNHKGTFVTQVSATDDDQRGRGNIIYHIIDGNHDNAFAIDPPFSGIVKTNIVLDREIRDNYFLTIIATDEGLPQLTGTCVLKITIVDVNDNQPVFPPYNVVSISEGTVVGTVITTITANDVDTNPALIYSFAEGGNSRGVFNIDRFSGRITLAKPLDHEKQDQYQLQLQVSDSAHLAETYLAVYVTDINDNIPVFMQQSYQVQLSEFVEPGYSVIKVNATDLDSGENARLTYSLGEQTHANGFYINKDTGIIYTNKTLTFNPKRPIIHLIVKAQDNGVPPLADVAAVQVEIVDVNNNVPKFSQSVYNAHISEDTPLGITVLKVSATDLDESRSNYQISYFIFSGNFGGTFSISKNTGEIILVKKLDREDVETFSLQVVATDRGTPTLNTTAEVIIQVLDVNDNPPLFNQSQYEVFLSELAPVGTTVLNLMTSDKDETGHSRVTYNITSGNTENKFQLNFNNGIITLVETLDYESVQQYHFVVQASDGDSKHPLSSLASITIQVNDENDNNPYFPLLMYTEFVKENSPVGTSVFMAHANDGDRGTYGKLNYSITDGDGKDKFSINMETGIVSTDIVFDYEAKNRFYFTIMAIDKGGKYTTVQAQINIESKDEYPPEFTHSSYHFMVPGNAPTGFVVGKVKAEDMDEGVDGHVLYHLRESHRNFKVNGTTGVITIKSLFNYEPIESRHDQSSQDVSLVVVAGSGRPYSLTSLAMVEITIDYTLNATSAASAEEKVEGSLPAWALGLVIVLAIIAVVLLSLIVFLRMRNKRSGKPSVIQGFDNSFDTIDIRSPPSHTSGISQFPPHYNDISHFNPANRTQHINGTTSEVSDQSHSASSGRGSAEDGDVEDEEIRMINEGPLLQQHKIQRLTVPDSGIHPDDDNLSDISVQNTQEYLARLGINTSHSDPHNIQDFNKIQNAHSVESMHMFDEEGSGEGNSMNIGNLIYSKLNDVGTEENNAIMDGTRAFGFGDDGEPSMTGSLSSIVHSEEELTGSYNWDYLLDWGPQYQPLAHVFAEIARLKDDDVPPSFSNSPKKTLNPQVKTLPPPLITNVAPCSIAPVALSSGHTSQTTSLPSLPRSPISHESTFSSLAMSPSFSPALSPLATRSPSISPLVPSGGGVATISGLVTPHYSRYQRSSNPATIASSGSETELQI